MKQGRLLVLGLVLCALGAAGWAYRARSRPARPHVVIVCVDGLRPADLDHMPAVTGLTSRGARFDLAYAQSNGAALSLASLLAGRYASEIAPIARFKVPPDLATLPKRLKMKGYSTGAFVSTAVAETAGLPLGFDRFEGAAGSTLAAASALAVAWAKPQQDVPLFLLVQGDDALASDHDAGVRQADGACAALLEQLRTAGLDDRSTLVVLISSGARSGLQAPDLQVPLVISGWGTVASRSSRLVQLVDIAPTIAGLLDGGSWEGVRGESLATVLSGASAPRKGEALAYADGVRAGATVIDGRQQLVAEGARAGTARMVEALKDARNLRLYDLARDPEARSDRTADSAAAPALDALRAVLLRQTELSLAATHVSDRPQIDDELRETLRSHGYWAAP